MSRQKKKQSSLERFAHNLRVNRLELGISQENLAAHAGISQTFLSQVESGKRNVSIEVADHLAGGLGMDLVDLLQLIPR